MPTYDYRCSTCGEHFELFQSFSDDALVRCPTRKSGEGPVGCAAPGRGKVTKIFSAPGITFKGSGFYKTDNRSSAATAGKTSTNGDSATKKADAKSSSDSTTSTSSASSTD